MLINNIRKSPTCPIRNTIHAPTRGATSAVAWKWKLHIISIHAPTRGATPYGLLTANVRLFQSTLLQEERLGESWRKEVSDRFQSTLLQEERLFSCIIMLTNEQFQSTLLQEERHNNTGADGRI